MRKFCLFVATAASVTAVPAEAAAPLPDAVPIEQFAALPSIQSPRLSPDGTKVAAKVAINGKQVLVVSNLSGNGARKALPPGKVDINWWRWVNDDWLVVGLGDQDKIYDEEVYVTRIAGVKADMSKIVPLGWTKTGLDADDILWIARDGSTRILTSKSTGYFVREDYLPSVWQADVATGEMTRILKSHENVVDWDADGDGNVRMGYLATSDDRLGVLYRRDGTSKFDKVMLKRAKDQTIPIPQVYRRDGIAIAIADDGGRNEVYELNLPSFTLGKKLFGDPKYDIDDVIANAPDDDLDGIVVVDRKMRVDWLNPDLKAIQADLDKSVGVGNGRIISLSRDRKKMLVEVGDPSQAGSIYFWNTNGSRMDRIGYNQPELKSRKLSPVKTITYTARDGTPIEAVLTLPRNRPATNLPLIMMPHGGPAARDMETFDWWTQFLAEQGYAVIQPNYRGSSGYGVAFQKLGEGEWGLKMQDDLLDAIDYAAKQGIIDRKRVCIVGASYGGYAAMRGAQRDAAHYRCAISYAGVSDLSAMKRYDTQFLLGKYAKSYWKKQVRDFTSVSPRFQAAGFGAPILIAHGVEDKRV
ncbi:MAG TPA: prolyl oligopeptidase family serine peptidase, partial [Sphingomicrobium sp.]|nr:prolyl oligopeptidase family serine peptidase [Sphingomicrobium sp.]